MSNLMTLKQAEQIQQEYDWALESWHECRAEAGMGAVSMGFDGHDGMTDYSNHNPAPQRDAEVNEADAVIAMFRDLIVRERSEYGRYGIIFADDAVVPEFYPFGVKDADPIPF